MKVGRNKKVASSLDALAEKNRLGIVLCLADGEKCVCDIFKHLKLPQNLVSHHLSVLRQIGLIKNRKDGKRVYYCLNEKKIKELTDFFNDIDCCCLRHAKKDKK